MIDVVQRLNAFLPDGGINYSREGNPQTAAEYDEMIGWPEDAATPKPSWNMLIALGDVELEGAKKEAYRIIDEAAGNARKKYITDVPGQAATYLLKAQHADAYKAAGYPADTTNFPMVVAEMSATGMAAIEAANYIIGTRDQWVMLAAEIEKQRRAGKIAVGSAAGETEITAASNTAVAALKAI